MNEEDIISLFYPPGTEMAGHQFLDDCAALPLPEKDNDILVTTDSMCQGTHFRMDWSGPEDLAIKLFQSNLSDLCVSGGRPQFALLNLGIPASLPDNFLPDFAGTLLEQMNENSCKLIGGDTFRAERLCLSLTLGGPAKRHLTRKGGRPGNGLYLTGDVGLSLAGYRHLKGSRILPATEKSPIKAALTKHLRPEARCRWAAELIDMTGVYAALDISDGIFQDARRLAHANNISLQIDLEKIPVAKNLSDYLTVEEALHSGEEYEILFLADPDLSFSFPCTQIGMAHRVQESAGVVYSNREGEIEIQDSGYNHFSYSNK